MCRVHSKWKKVPHLSFHKYHEVKATVNEIKKTNTRTRAIHCWTFSSITFCKKGSNRKGSNHRSPVNNGIYNSRSVLFDLEADEAAFFSYLDNINGRGRWRNLGRLSFTYFRPLSFRDGFNEVTIRATDRNGNFVDIIRGFRVDSRAPRIARTKPRRGFVNGEFTVQFTEANPSILELNYGTISDTRNKVLDIENDCVLYRRRYSCSTEVNLEDFDGKKIRYWFELTDISGASDESRLVEIDVDTTDPVLDNPGSFWEQGEDRLNRYIFFNLEIDEDNFKEVNYIDLNSLRPRERRICSRLREGVCERRTAFRSGDHVLDVNILDKAGNSITERVEFSVV